MPDNLCVDLGNPKVTEQRQDMDTPGPAIVLKSPRATPGAAILQEVGQILLIEVAERHRPAPSQPRLAVLVHETPQEPARFLARLFDLFESHFWVEIGTDVESGAPAHSDLHDGPAHPEAGTLVLLQDVVVTLPFAGEIAEGAAHDFQVDAGDPGS